MRKLLLFGLALSANIAFGQYSGTPLMLSLPMDQDTIEEDEPVFVWQTTLSNVQNDPRLNVQLAVVKMDDDQTQTEAMVENTPVFIRQNLLSNSLNYSSIDNKLEQGTWYAWQVVLFYNGVQVQQSEVRKFIKAEKTPPQQLFYSLRTSLDNSIVEVSGNTLYVMTNEPGEFTLSANITGRKIKPQNILFTEIIGENEQTRDESVHHSEFRYFKCDLGNLKKGDYRIQWDANSNKSFFLFVKKI